MPRFPQSQTNNHHSSPAPSTSPKLYSYSSPLSQAFKSPGPAISTPSSGTYTAARTQLKFGQNGQDKSDQFRNKENFLTSAATYSDALTGKSSRSFSPAPGSLAEAAFIEKANIKAGIRGHSRQSSGGGGGQGGAVRSGQLQGWQNKTTANFYGAQSNNFEETCDRSKLISPVQKAKKSKAENSKEGLAAKINRCSSKVDQGDHTLADGDFDLKNFEEEKDEAGDLLDTIDITDSSDSLTHPFVANPYNIGFKNYGNTCYLNASLQSLLGLPMVVMDVLNSRLTVDITESGQGLMRAFSELCLAYTKGRAGQANLKMQEIKRVMEKLDKQFVGTKMQDASEFLSRFIDELNEDLSRVKTSKSEKVNEVEGCEINTASSMVIRNFQHEREDLFVCCKCESQTRGQHSDMSMWCDMVSHNRTRSVSLQQLLEQSLAKEERERRCDECGCETATATSSLIKLPIVLIVYLKRYKYDTQELAPSAKVSKVIDIPDTVCLTSLVGEKVALPSSFLPALAPHPTQEVAPNPQSPPATPTKSRDVSTAGLDTPVKFKGLEEAEVSKMSEDDQMEYLMYISQKEALTSSGPEGGQEDKDLLAALEASMMDETFNQIINMADTELEPNRDDLDTDTEQKTGPIDENVGTGICKTPARKRSFGQLGSGEFVRSGGNDEEVADSEIIFKNETEYDKLEQTMGFKQFDRKIYSKAVKGKEGDQQESRLQRPATKEEEDADLQRALELSTREAEKTLVEDTSSNQFQWAMEDNENNNSEEANCSTTPFPGPVPGLPEHSYHLHSVVSHYGASATSGHYVADVFRFDGGGWFRYDDTRVTKTDSRAVRTGTNTANGYIFTYLYQPLWEKCKRQAEEGQ